MGGGGLACTVAIDHQPQQRFGIGFQHVCPQHHVSSVFFALAIEGGNDHPIRRQAQCHAVGSIGQGPMDRIIRLVAFRQAQNFSW